MALPPLFQTRATSANVFAVSQGLSEAAHRLPLPGNVIDNSLHDTVTANFPESVQVTDIEPTGTFNSTGVWRLTVIPALTQAGAASADAMAEAYVEFTASGSTQQQVVDGLIAAVATGATAATPAAAESWVRFRSYVSVAQSTVATDIIRATATGPGFTFSLEMTGPAGGDSYTVSAIETIQTGTAKCGLFYAIDRTLGTNGFDEFGNPYIKPVTSSTPVADIIGPVETGERMLPKAVGYSFEEYGSGSVPMTRYGHVTVYSEAAVTLSSGPEAIYVRHTTVGDYVAGLAADATKAAEGATANLWTGTITAVDNTLYQVSIQVVNNDGVVVSEDVSFTSGGSTTATLISTGLKANLTTRLSLTGLVTGGGTSTLTLTGPADGRAVTVTNLGPGAISFAETTAEVSTHTRLDGDRVFYKPSTRIGAAAANIPNAGSLA